MVNIAYLVEESLVISHIITEYAVTPLLILFVGLALAAFIRNLSKAGLQAVQLDMRVGQRLPFSATNTIAHSIFATLSVFSVGLALRSVGLLTLALQRLSILIASLTLLSLILVGTDFVRNRYHKKRAIKQYQIGNTYYNYGLSGVVKKHGLTHLVIFTTQAERVHVPYLKAARAKN